MAIVKLKLDEVLQRLGINLVDLKQVWVESGALYLDWLHADSDESRQCSASVGFEACDRGMGFFFFAEDFRSDPETDWSEQGFLVVDECTGFVEVTGNFDFLCDVVRKIRVDPARYENGSAIRAALVREELRQARAN